MTRARGYVELTAAGAPLAQLPPEVPATDDTPTICVACGAALRDCGCGAAQRADANRVINDALAAGVDPAAALAAWRGQRP